MMKAIRQYLLKQEQRGDGGLEGDGGGEGWMDGWLDEIRNGA